MTVHLKQGRTWTPTIEVVRQDGFSFDCTAYTVVLYLKSEYSESADFIHTLPVTWSDRANGKGYFKLTHAQSKDLIPRTYYYEIVLYTTLDQTLVRTMDKGKLIITTTLEKDIQTQFVITESMSPALIRNAEGDNVSASSTTTLIEITAVNGNTLTLNTLPENLIFSTDIDWFVQSLDSGDYNVAEPSYSGDYLVQDKITSFDFDNNKITLVDATDFTVGKNICIYSPWANYEFLPGQESEGIINTDGAAAWRDYYNQPGPSWYDKDNSRYIVLINGRTSSGDPQVGYAYCSDLEANSWTMGNSDAPIITFSSHTNFAQLVIASGNAIELSSGQVAFAVVGRDAAGDEHTHVVRMDKDCTNITISDGLTESLTTYFGGGLAYYDSKYVLMVINASFGSLLTWTLEMWESTTIDSGYTKTTDVYTTEYDGNDSVWLEVHPDSLCPFVENGTLYCFVSSTQRYTISGVQGNRVFGLMVYDGSSWSVVNDFAPEIIFPMYFYNIPSEDYGWAGGHGGGGFSFVKRDGKCYAFTSFLRTIATYQVAALELKNKT